MRFQLLSIMIIVIVLYAIATQSTSKYDGVSWNKQRNLWQAEFHIHGKRRKSYFGNEFDAAKHFNRLCVEMGIHSENLDICAIPNQQTKEKTSQYKGVSYDIHRGKWNAQIRPKGQKRTYGGTFNDELDAAKKVNQLCEELSIPLFHPEISAIPNQQYQFKTKTSQYKGVYYDKQTGKWKVKVYFKGNGKYGGLFNYELDAAKVVNQLCEELGIPPQNPLISAMPNQQYQSKQKPSQYKGVTYDKQTCKWNVLVYVKGQKQKYGGQFNNELDAAKRVNQLCEELGIPQKTPTISAMPNQQHKKKEKISEYKGVYWHKESKKWYVVYSKNQKQNYGGCFNEELDAAKRVNQLCAEMEIPPLNPTTSAIPNQQQFKEKTSQYKGVWYDKQTCKWKVIVSLKGQKQKYGGQFNDELDAAKKVNQLCEELGIPQKNLTISAMPNQQHKTKEKTSQYKGVYYHKQADKWYARFHIKGQTTMYGGIFNDELDAGKKVNQLCDDFGIPQKNPGISGIQNQQYQHDDYETANLFNSKILETDNDNAKKKKRKRQKQINDDDELSFEKYYFYDHLLK